MATGIGSGMDGTRDSEIRPFRFSRILRRERKCLAGVDSRGDGDAADGVGHGRLPPPAIPAAESALRSQACVVARNSSINIESCGEDPPSAIVAQGDELDQKPANSSARMLSSST